MMPPYRRVLSPTPVDLLERLVTEKEQQKVGLEKEGNGWRAWGQVDGWEQKKYGLPRATWWERPCFKKPN